MKTIKAIWDWLGDLEDRMVDWADNLQNWMDRL